MKPEKRIAVYAGSFDPPTNGHLWMIEKGSQIFDQLIVAIGINPDKKYTFNVEERLEMLKSSTSHLRNVVYSEFTNKYLVNYASEVKADFILRGIRNNSDSEYERAMCNTNRDINPDITTVFLTPPRDLCEISSSFIKGLIGSENWEKVVSRYVPNPVFSKLREKFSQK